VFLAIKDYFYWLERELFQVELPHWAIHRDLFSYQVGENYVKRLKSENR
jgi:hypothetical protein